MAKTAFKQENIILVLLNKQNNTKYFVNKVLIRAK